MNTASAAVQHAERRALLQYIPHNISVCVWCCVFVCVCVCVCVCVLDEFLFWFSKHRNISHHLINFAFNASPLVHIDHDI